MTDEPMLTLVVRGFGYDVRHVVTVPQSSVITSAWPSEAYPFQGVRTPVIARCGVTIRSVQPVLVVMALGTLATCTQCARWSGLRHQKIDLYAALPAGTP